MAIGEHVSSIPLEVTVIAERVVNCIECSHIQDERARVIFAKSQTLFGKALRASEALESFATGQSAPFGLKDFISGQDYYQLVQEAAGQFLATRHAKKWGGYDQSVHDLVVTLNETSSKLAQGEMDGLSSDQVSILGKFARVLEDVATGKKERSLDRVFIR